MAVRTRLRTKATKLSNDLRTYRQGDPKSLDQDQLALKIHHVEQTLEELRTIQTQLDELKQPDDSSHVQTLEDEHFLGSRLLARLERAEEASVKVDRSPTMNLDLQSSLSVKLPTFKWRYNGVVGVLGNVHCVGP